jgi:hypothetical protein
MFWIYLARDMEQWWVIFNTVRQFKICQGQSGILVYHTFICR